MKFVLKRVMNFLLLHFAVSQVKETGELSTCLQIKFYRQADLQHCEWGSRLHCIELDCSAAEGSLSVTVSNIIGL
jgi:CB1 cannabinoid receptor-interacting protein 1